MAIVYLDSSAFVKLLVQEDGSDIAAALWDGCDAAVLAIGADDTVFAVWDQRLRTGAQQAAQRLAPLTLTQ